MSKIDENDTGDMAAGFGNIMQPQSRFNNLPAFKIEKAAEYHSFSKGIKSFHRWSQHTTSEGIRQWAKANKGKDFYVTHNESYTLIKRSKK